jgi:hypothetical protein
MLNDVRFEVHTAMTMKTTVIWDMTPCGLVDLHPRRGYYSLSSRMFFVIFFSPYTGVPVWYCFLPQISQLFLYIPHISLACIRFPYSYPFVPQFLSRCGLVSRRSESISQCKGDPCVPLFRCLATLSFIQLLIRAATAVNNIKLIDVNLYIYDQAHVEGSQQSHLVQVPSLGGAPSIPLFN